MKNIKKLQIVLLICIAFVVVSCELQPQERFTFNPETPSQFTFGETTAWEWLQTNPGGEYTYMVQAIKHAGLEDIFNNPTAKRTFFFIKDTGWSESTKPNTILNREFGSQDILIEATDPVKLRNVLLYYVLPKYVDQGPDNLFTLDFHYEFNTLSPDPLNKIMTLRRDWNYTIGLNYDPNLPPAPSSIATSCKLHNYIFSNGNSVAHIVETHTRLAPFQ